MELSVNMLLTSILFCGAGPGFSIRTVRLLVQHSASYHGYHVPLYLSLSGFFSETPLFTLRKLYVCLETFSCFFHHLDRLCVSRARCVGPLLGLPPAYDSNLAVYAKCC